MDNSELDAIANRLTDLVNRAQYLQSMTVTVTLIELKRKNEQVGLTQSEMQYFVNRLENLLGDYTDE